MQYDFGTRWTEVFVGYMQRFERLAVLSGRGVDGAAEATKNTTYPHMQEDRIGEVMNDVLVKALDEVLAEVSSLSHGGGIPARQERPNKSWAETYKTYESTFEWCRYFAQRGAKLAKEAYELATINADMHAPANLVTCENAILQARRAALDEILACIADYAKTSVTTPPVAA